MLRQLVSRSLFGRASTAVCVTSSSPSSYHSSSCYSSNFSINSPRWFSSSSSPQKPPSSHSDSDIPPNFFKNPDGENLSHFSEETSWSGHSKYLIPGPFGTIEKPAIIYSEYESRIVGCEGGDGLPHELQYFILKKGPKHVCQDCGQVFLLQAAPAGTLASRRSFIGENPDEHGHGHGHGEHDGHKKDDKGHH